MNTKTHCDDIAEIQVTAEGFMSIKTRHDYFSDIQVANYRLSAPRFPIFYDPVLLHSDTDHFVAAAYADLFAAAKAALDLESEHVRVLVDKMLEAPSGLMKKG